MTFYRIEQTYMTYRRRVTYLYRMCKIKSRFLKLQHYFIVGYTLYWYLYCYQFMYVLLFAFDLNSYFMSVCEPSMCFFGV